MSPPPAARPPLLEGSVAAVLWRTTIPMLLGMVAMMAVNLVDTYWVSRLGTGALAAMSFTFPIEALVINIALGLMIGTSVSVARAVGAGRPEQAVALTTDATLLAVGVVAVVSVAGLAFQDTIFGLMGAKDTLLADVRAYMTPWFVGVGFLIVPMIANGALRALGDAQTPMRVMMLGAIINAVLDPLLIFGAGPIPAMGLQGASIATVIARFVVMVVVFAVLIRKARLLDPRGLGWQRLRSSTATLGRVAVPAMVTNAVGPLAIGVLTGLVAQHGPSAVAAWGVGARVDAILLMVPMALTGALSPFVGQNHGAHLKARVADGLRRSLVFVIAWGAGAAALAMAVAPALAAAFSADPAVQAQLTTMLRVVPVGYAFVGVVATASSALNAVDRAQRAALLSVLRSMGIALPAAFVGNAVAGFPGILAGLVGASIGSALLGTRWLTDLLTPLGAGPRGAGPRLGPDDIRTWLQAQPAWAALTAPVVTACALDAVQVHLIRGDQLGIHVGARELAHLHPSGLLDLPLPVEVGDNLVRLGIVIPHPAHEDNGWYRFSAAHPAAAQVTGWLVGLAHLLYALSLRGAGDPITQAEMNTYTQTPQCVAAMKAAAARWDALPVTGV